MPLTAKGKKLKKKFKEQYGKKKGESVFYAMENSGKLKKVIKRVGGGADMGKDKGTETGRPGRSDRDIANRMAQTKQAAINKNKSFKDTGNKQVTTNKPKTITQTLFTPTPFMTVNLLKNLVVDPLDTKIKTQKAKGETLFGKPTGLPATRDYYKTTGKTLDVKSPEGKNYMKDAGLIKPVQPPKVDTKGGLNLCPDGSLPPCVKPAVTKAPTTTGSSSSSSSFLKDFIFYPLKSGGVSSGPPPKRGPNPQVPPVKLSRGGGAAIRGTKFKGVF